MEGRIAWFKRAVLTFRTDGMPRTLPIASRARPNATLVLSRAVIRTALGMVAAGEITTG
jgi:hypothetical protein